MSLALPDADPTPSVGNRQGTRTHLFVAATLSSGGSSAPAHIRNLSPNGAQVEAAVLPAPGTPVVLKRGNLEVIGRIVWQAGSKAGIAFHSIICVADWMARRGGVHQEKVDELVSALRSSAGDAANDDAGSSGTRWQIVEGELSLLRAELTQLGELLTADVVLVATHPEIQLLDISLQRIGRIMNHLGDSNSESLASVAS